MAINRVASQAQVLERARPQLEKAQVKPQRQAEAAAFAGVTTQERPAEAAPQQAARAPEQAPQQAPQKEDAFAKLNEALQSLEKALQALSFGGDKGFGTVGQDLGFSNTGFGNQQFGFNDQQQFQGGSWWDPQPAPQPTFLDNRGGGGGGGDNGNHYGWDKKSGGGGIRVDPGGANN